jgi:hypothetical protein
MMKMVFFVVGALLTGSVQVTQSFVYPRVPKLDLVTIWEPKSVVEQQEPEGNVALRQSPGRSSFLYTGETHKMNKLWTPQNYTSSLQTQPPLSFESVMESQSQLLDSELGLKVQQASPMEVAAVEPVTDQRTSQYLEKLAIAAEEEKVKVLGDAAAFSPPQVNAVPDRTKSLQDLARTAEIESEKMIGGAPAVIAPSAMPDKAQSLDQLAQAAEAERAHLLGYVPAPREAPVRAKDLQDLARAEKAQVLGSAPISLAKSVTPAHMQALAQAAEAQKAQVLGNTPGGRNPTQVADREQDRQTLLRAATGERLRTLGDATSYEYTPVVPNLEAKRQELVKAAAAQKYEILGHVPEATKHTSSIPRSQKLQALAKAAEAERVQVLSARIKGNLSVPQNFQNPIFWIVLKFGRKFGLPIAKRKDIRKYGN